MLSPAWRSRDGKTIDVAWYGNQDYKLILPNEREEVMRGLKVGDIINFRLVVSIDSGLAIGHIFKEEVEDGITKVFEHVPYDLSTFWLADPWIGGQKPAGAEIEICITARLQIGITGTTEVKPDPE